MPCGYYGSKTGQCRCSRQAIEKYLGRISGPLLDRIDIQLEIAAVPVKEITSSKPEEPSSAIRERVQEARRRQQERYAGEGLTCNAELTAKQVSEVCRPDENGQRLIEKAVEKYNLSMRAVSRILKVSRTIADLAGEENISQMHVAEALTYRNLEGKYWK